MTAEQFADAISAVTGVWREKVAGQFDFSLVSSHAAPPAGRVRAALVNADPLMTALGRPNREQVVTMRASAATTLQSLELSNGATLADALHRGAVRLKARTPQTDALVTACFSGRSAGRPRHANGRSACRRLDGRPRSAASRICSGAS